MTSYFQTGEVRCLNCSRSLGEVAQVGEDGQWRLVRPGAGGLTPRLFHGRLRCGHCGGCALIEQDAGH